MAERKEGELKAALKKFLEKQGIDIVELEKERKAIKEAVKKLDRRVQNARNQRRYSLSDVPPGRR